MNSAALWEAVQKNRVDDVKRLLDSGMSVLVTDAHENTLAHRAAEAGHLEILRLLRARGAPLDRRNWIDQSPLSLAAWKGHLPIVIYLCERNVSAHGRDLNSAPLSTAAAAGQLAIVRYLVEQRHVPLNALERPFGATPLFAAAAFLQVHVVRYLLAKGADPTIPTADGETALSRVKRLMRLRPKTPTPEEATRFRDLVACLDDASRTPHRAAPSSGAGSQNLLAHLIKPRKEWHYWL